MNDNLIGENEVSLLKLVAQPLLMRKVGFDFSFDPSKCAECGGKCCYGESGYVFLKIEEIALIAEFLNIPFEDMCLRYIRKVGYRFSLIEKTCNNKYMGVGCVFFNEDSMCCDIYPVRPKQCQSFPFWDSYADSHKNKDKNKKELIGRCIGVIT
ncbi:YkgJ family cysteine cluster protein [Helicobacter muridarum]|uniref:Flagellin N-methylase family protein n=2 Tax=Helicobacter muridarum TaxID=216 RepID=A0A377PWR4_9HELI|nr:YkgJ family cysteine cluster protein [Helicobacter muridarum]STQ86691.1 flagellin N-methylase family protein [Helicobacter muridarum]